MTTIDEPPLSRADCLRQSDLVPHAIGPSTAPNRDPHRSSPVARESPSRPSWERAAILVGLAGIVVYGMYYGAYSSFYAAFGLTPEDVGISWPQAFGRMSLAPVALVAAVSGPGLVLFLLAAVVLLGLLALLARLRARVLRQLPKAARVLGPGIGAVLVGWAPPPLAVALAASLVGFDAADAYRRGIQWPSPFGWLVEFILFLAIAWGVCALVKALTGRCLKFTMACAAVFVFLSSGSIALHSTVVEAARQLRDEGRWTWGAMAVGIVPQYVTVHLSATPNEPVRNGQTMLLLGSTGGVNALFDCESRTVLRIEAQNVALAHVPLATDADLEAAALQCRGE